MNLPILIPPQVEEIVGLRIGKCGHLREIPCYLECIDRTGAFLEVPVSLDDMAMFVAWLQEAKPEWPIKVF